MLFLASLCEKESNTSSEPLKIRDKPTVQPSNIELIAMILSSIFLLCLVFSSSFL